MACLPNDYACRVKEAAAGLGIGQTSGDANATASEMWKIAVGVAVLAILIDVAPRLGGWLLLLIVIGLALSPRARSIITG